jgi:hypothetical protein
MACAEICPDFALEVWKFEVPLAASAIDENASATNEED